MFNRDYIGAKGGGKVRNRQACNLGLILILMLLVPLFPGTTASQYTGIRQSYN